MLKNKLKVWNTQKKIFLDVLSIGQSKLRESRRDNKILEKKLDKIQAENEKLEQNLKLSFFSFGMIFNRNSFLKSVWLILFGGWGWMDGMG